MFCKAQGAFIGRNTVPVNFLAQVHASNTDKTRHDGKKKNPYLQTEKYGSK